MKNQILLDDTGTLGITLKYPTLESAFEYNYNIDTSFDVFVSCIESIFTEDEVFSAKEHTKEELTEFVEGLTSEQFDKMLNFYKNMPSLSHKEQCECSECNHKFDIEIRGLKDFFT